MAVEPDHAGRGLGATLLAAGLDRAFAAGAETVWANARDTALDFYRRHGFEVVDDGFLDRDDGARPPPHPPPSYPDFPFRSLPTPMTGEALRWGPHREEVEWRMDPPPASSGDAPPRCVRWPAGSRAQPC